MQWRVAIWILGVFWTLLLFCIEAIAGLIPIYLYLQKLSGRFQLRTQSLPSNHIIKLLLESRYSDTNNCHYILLKNLTSQQWLKTKCSVINTNNKLNRIFPLFNSFSSEFSSRSRLINIFSSCFSFHSPIQINKEGRKVHIHKLNKIIFQISTDSKIAVVVLDVSIKNQVATLIAHIHIHNNPIIKTLHYVINVTSTKAEFFAIRCGINQAIQLLNIRHIIVITDSMHASKKIFDSSIYLY